MELPAFFFPNATSCTYMTVDAKRTGKLVYHLHVEYHLGPKKASCARVERPGNFVKCDYLLFII